MNQFLQIQGMTTKLYPLRYCEEEMTPESQKLAIALRVTVDFSPSIVAPRSRGKTTVFSSRLAGRKIRQPRGGKYY